MIDIFILSFSFEESYINDVTRYIGGEYLSTSRHYKTNNQQDELFHAILHPEDKSPIDNPEDN
jgi:hypothetical protein